MSENDLVVAVSANYRPATVEDARRWVAGCAVRLCIVCDGERPTHHPLRRDDATMRDVRAWIAARVDAA